MAARCTAPMPPDSLRRMAFRSIVRPALQGTASLMTRPIRDIRSHADLDEAVRRCELRWQALQLGMSEGEITTLLAIGLEWAEARLRLLGPPEPRLGGDG
jgi:hypothetical protein